MMSYIKYFCLFFIIIEAKATGESYCSLRRNGLQICAGTIINQKWIATAAHCVAGGAVAGLTVRVNSGTVVAVQAITVHPNYVATTLENDIALLELQVTIQLSTNVQVAVLPNTGLEITAGITATASGLSINLDLLGLIQLSVNLGSVSVTVSSQQQCQAAYPNVRVVNDKFCAVGFRGSSSCALDAGAPITSNGVVIGIFLGTSNCGSATAQALCESLPSLRAWITATVSL